MNTRPPSFLAMGGGIQSTLLEIAWMFSHNWDTHIFQRDVQRPTDITMRQSRLARIFTSFSTGTVLIAS